MASSGRSGSTWLAEVMTATPGNRFILDPTGKLNRNFRHGVPFAAYVDPMEDDYRLSTLFDQVFSGRYRSSFADQRNRARLPIRRFVKDTNTVNLLPWIVAHYPEVPIIYLLRHPFAVSWSYTELGWRSDPLGRLLVNEHFGSHQAEFSAELIRQTFLYNVTLWCAENCLAVRELAPGSVHPIFYETMVAQPERELDSLVAFLSRTGGAWRNWTPILDAVNKPSWMSVRRSPAADADGWTQTWQRHVDEETGEAGHRILTAFGLDRVYSTGPLPLVGRDDLLLGGGAS